MSRFHTTDKLALLTLVLVVVLGGLITGCSLAWSAAIPIPGTRAAAESNDAIKDYLMPDTFPKDPNIGWDDESGPVSCCGPADAYIADDFAPAPEGSGYWGIAIITDERDDSEFRKPNYDKGGGQPRDHIPAGTRIPIPLAKVIPAGQQKPNLTGHGWVWASVYYDEVTGEITGINVFCYLEPAGL